MVQIGDAEDEEKPRFASMLKGQSIDSITLEEALKLFELPRTLGQYQDEEVVVGIGKYGPYIKYGKTNITLPKEHRTSEAIEKLGLNEALEIIRASGKAT